jgi:GxxExxY protein
MCLARNSFLADFAELADNRRGPTPGTPVLHEPITNKILGSFFEIYRVRGFGFLENVYTNSLAVELGLRGLEVRREIPVQVHWKGELVGTYRMDLLVENKVLVEVKSCDRLVEAHYRQLLNYLKATGLEVGLLLNFGPDPQFVRRVFTNDAVSATTQ